MMHVFRLGWLIAAIIFFSLLLILGSIPGQAHILSGQVGDKLLHILAYGLLALLCYQSFAAKKNRRIIFTLLMIAVLGLLDEALQSLLPYRNASLLDWCFDMAAALNVVTLLAVCS